MKISAVLIVKNEESCLEKCLKSLLGFDEIVICDTGSTDKTIEIAKKYTDKIFTDYKWEDSFCKARNHALSKCTGDWIFTIDADETLESNGLAKIRKGVEFAEKHNQKTINCIMVANISEDEFLFPRLYKKCPEVYWKGDVHNYLSITDNNKSDIRITYSYSQSHSLDPNRSLRILKRVMKEKPDSIREAFYLAREYFYRKDYITATFWYRDYLTRANWAPETSEAWLMLSRCLWKLDKNSEAKDACLQALKINAGFKEAVEFMADLCGKNNRKQWLLYSNLASNENVLTLRKKKEKDSIYYNELFNDCSDMSRYYHLYNKCFQLTLDKKVLDIGCGLATLRTFIKDYSGFDFASEVINKINNPKIWIGNIYDESNYKKEDYEIYIATEVLEHVDDFKLLKNVPSHKQFIFSVPSFEDESHLRIYTEKIVRTRFEGILEIKSIVRFNWNNGWHEGGQETENYILLVESTKL